MTVDLRQRQIVAIVDDNQSERESICAALRSRNYAVNECASGQELLAWDWPREFCVLAEVDIPGVSGLQLLSSIRERNPEIPVVIMTARGDVALAVRAMKAGAVDFIEKPAALKTLLDAVEGVFARQPVRGSKSMSHGAGEDMANILTVREIDVLEKIASGLSNKETAKALGVSHRTVEFHRSNILRKTHSRNLADLMYLYVRSCG